jgi:hypothetical protein
MRNVTADSEWKEKMVWLKIELNYLTLEDVIKTHKHNIMEHISQDKGGDHCFMSFI